MPVNQMVIDLRLCVGCGTCAIACKLGNNTQIRDKGQSFNWADFMIKQPPGLSNRWMALPVKCNHCADPKCVAACPVAPITDTTCVGDKRKAMYKLKDAYGGLVLHDDARCIGCRNCQRNCPYSVIDLGAYNAQASVISFNFTQAHNEWQSTKELFPGMTGSPAEIADTVGTTPPYRTDWTNEGGYGGDNIRPGSVVEKCYGCYHRVLAATKRLPYCVQACPANARKIVSGDTFLNDQDIPFASVAPDDPNVDDAKVLSSLPPWSELRVLKQYSMGEPVLVGPYWSPTQSRPQTFYWGNFNP